MNIDKTIAKVLGPEPLPSNNLYGLTWTKDPIETLGVTLSGDEDDHYILNFKKKAKEHEKHPSNVEMSQLIS